MANGMMLHCGGKPSTREGLDLVPMPEETATFKPVSHYQLTLKVLEISQDLLNGYTLKSESYGLAREGQQLFALATFQNHDTEMGLSIAWRSSYDKSMTVGIAEGSSVFICDNLALKGDVTYMRKHTGSGLWAEIEEKLIAVCYKANKTFSSLITDKEKMKQIEFSDRKAFETMGVLYGEGIISPRQLTIVKDEWLKPSHEAFQPRTAWSLYNANTEALKTSPPISVMENHTKLTRYFNDNVIDI